MWPWGLLEIQKAYEPMASGNTEIDVMAAAIAHKIRARVMVGCRKANNLLQSRLDNGRRSFRSDHSRRLRPFCQRKGEITAVVLKLSFCLFRTDAIQIQFSLIGDQITSLQFFDRPAPEMMPRFSRRLATGSLFNFAP
jgi:hypothetical protein